MLVRKHHQLLCGFGYHAEEEMTNLKREIKDMA